MQFLAFAFVYRLFEKLKAFESPVTRIYNVSLIFYDSTFVKFWNFPFSHFVELLVELYSSCYCWLQEEGEDTGEGLRMGKRLLRALALVFGCVAISSLVWWFLRSFGVTYGSVLWYPKFLASVSIDVHIVFFFSCNKKRKEEGSIHLFTPFSYFTLCETKLLFIMVWCINYVLF